MKLKKCHFSTEKKNLISQILKKKILDFSFFFSFLCRSCSFLTNKHSKTEFFFPLTKITPQKIPSTKSNINKLKPSQRSLNYFLNTISFLSNQTEKEYIINIIESFQQTQELSAVKPRQNVNKNKMKWNYNTKPVRSSRWIFVFPTTFSSLFFLRTKQKTKGNIANRNFTTHSNNPPLAMSSTTQL